MKECTTTRFVVCVVRTFMARLEITSPVHYRASRQVSNWRCTGRPSKVGEASKLLGMGAAEGSHIPGRNGGCGGGTYPGGAPDGRVAHNHAEP